MNFLEKRKKNEHIKLKKSSEKIVPCIHKTWNLAWTVIRTFIFSWESPGSETSREFNSCWEFKTNLRGFRSHQRPIAACWFNLMEWRRLRQKRFSKCGEMFSIWGKENRKDLRKEAQWAEEVYMSVGGVCSVVRGLWRRMWRMTWRRGSTTANLELLRPSRCFPAIFVWEIVRSAVTWRWLMNASICTWADALGLGA